ncbi:hypothetical protein WMY93_029609 [Mugilogobius chulae]|uniref:PHD-type domain-containing protein n=1 Tax=Mugilogobius chulae TaxID=88201 RepID=A0AAW0MM49_9GOBI
MEERAVEETSERTREDEEVSDETEESVDDLEKAEEDQRMERTQDLSEERGDEELSEGRPDEAEEKVEDLLRTETTEQEPSERRDVVVDDLPEVERTEEEPSERKEDLQRADEAEESVDNLTKVEETPEEPSSELQRKLKQRREEELQREAEAEERVDSLARIKETQEEPSKELQREAEAEEKVHESPKLEETLVEPSKSSDLQREAEEEERVEGTEELEEPSERREDLQEAEEEKDTADDLLKMEETAEEPCERREDLQMDGTDQEPSEIREEVGELVGAAEEKMEESELTDSLPETDEREGPELQTVEEQREASVRAKEKEEEEEKLQELSEELPEVTDDLQETEERGEFNPHVDKQEEAAVGAVEEETEEQMEEPLQEDGLPLMEKEEKQEEASVRAEEEEDLSEQEESEMNSLEEEEEKIVEEEAVPSEKPSTEAAGALSPDSPPSGVQLTSAPSEEPHSPPHSPPASPVSPQQAPSPPKPSPTSALRPASPQSHSRAGSPETPSAQTQNQQPTNHETLHITQDQEMESADQTQEPANHETESTNEKREIVSPNQSVFSEELKSTNETSKNHDSERTDREDELLMDDNSCSSLLDTDQSRSSFRNAAVEGARMDRSEAVEEREEVFSKEEMAETAEMTEQSDEEEFEVISNEEVLKIQEEMLLLEEEFERSKDLKVESQIKSRKKHLVNLKKEHLEMEVSADLKTRDETEEKQIELSEKENSPRNNQSKEEQEEAELVRHQQDKTLAEAEEMVDESEALEEEIGEKTTEKEVEDVMIEDVSMDEPEEKADVRVDQSEAEEESVERAELDEDKMADKPKSPEKEEFSINDEEVGSMCEDSQDKEDSDLEDAVSPVLDLDPSLDMEVMALMSSGSPPPSLLTLSSPSPTLVLPRRGKGRSALSSPENSPTRLTMASSPLSPMTPPLRASPSNQRKPASVHSSHHSHRDSLHSQNRNGKTSHHQEEVFSRTSPSPTVFLVSSRRAVSPPSSSQDSNDGWRQSESPALRTLLCGHEDGPRFGVSRPEEVQRRRHRGPEEEEDGADSRLRTASAFQPGGGYMESFQMRDEEENSMHNTVVMFSTSDHFTLKQDMCVVCGSFGQGEEGRLLACAQCGQCYHPYCVNVKITRVILTKGWRCLECTVCEACGEASDPGRLLLCDDCDISYHTYCLDPPLHTVPKGAWKCKWCVWCVQCGSTSPGLHCDWMNNYSLTYSQDDLILQCQQCDRWVHAVCHGLMSEEEVESTADEGFDCSLCKNHGRATYARSDSFDSPYMAQIISRFREPDLKTYTQDGVCLTESGLSHLQSLVEPLTSPRRYRRNKPKLKLRIINQNSVSVLQTPEPETPTEPEPPRADLDCEMKSDSSPEREPHHDDYIHKETETADGKKRKRKPYRPGIGGFMVRQRGGKGPSRIKLCRSDSTDTYPGRDDDADAMDTSADHSMEKVKKRYRKKRTKLEETFPSYLQEAFFGRDLLDRSRLIDRRAAQEAPGLGQSGPTAASGQMKGPAPVSHGHAPQKHGPLPVSEEALVDLSDVLNTDPHILATGQTGQFQAERSPSPFAGLDIGSVEAARAQRSVQEEPLDAILSPELDKMVSDGAILSKLYKIPELEGKDVEDLFTAVLSPNRSGQSEAQGSSKPHPPVPGGQFPRLPLVNGLMGSSSHFSGSPMMPLGPQATPRFRMTPPPHAGPAPPLPGHSMQPSNQAQSPAEDQDVLSTAQRGMLKWEKEEPLGEQATVAPVLYCNIKFPQLKEQYPDWPSRMKQIAKQWRKASSQDRAPFVQKARDNRAAQRINKVQLPPDPLKRLPVPPPQQQQQMTYDPVSMETDAMFKDPLRPKETEQEQEWKMRQQMRQQSKQRAKSEAAEKLEQVKNEQLLQQRPAADSDQSEAVRRRFPGYRQPQPHGVQSAGFRAGGRRVSASSGSAPLRFLSLLSSDVLPTLFTPVLTVDPYGKVVGTPRPPSAPQPPLQPRRNSLSASPAHDALGSPAPSPDAKAAEMYRNMAPQQALQQQIRPGMLSPSAPDHSRLSYQRPVFKAPMPPHQQDFPGPRRDPARPTDLGFPLAQTQDFPSSPLSGLGSPHRSPYSQAPGTPRPDYTQQAGEAFSHHSPLTSRPSPDPYSNPQTPGTPRFPRSPVGTPRPSPEAYNQGTDTFSGQGTSGSSPRAPGWPEAAGFTPHHQLQRSPGRPQQQTPKHPGISEEGHTPGHDPFEQSHMTPQNNNDKLLASNELSALGADGPMSMMPQLGDSEDKLRQRQRLRQLILRQQQQKSALRQEKGLQEAGPGQGATAAPGHNATAALGPPTPGHIPQSPAAPGHAPSAQDHAPSARHWPQPQEEPDPFGRPPPPYPGQMRPVAPPLRGSTLNSSCGVSHLEKQGLSRDRCSSEDHTSGLRFLQELRGCRTLSCVFPRTRLPRDQAWTQPSPSHDARSSPASLPSALSPSPASPLAQHHGTALHRAPTPRPRAPPPPALSSGGRRADGGAPGGEDSAVKDLEDVEVKDLVDLNLNLDPEDGKEDLDLAANDLHLDDFLLTGKFDLIAYTDPELNLDNADLDLDPSDQDRDRNSGEHSSQSGASNQIKQEVKPEGREAGSVPQNQAPHPGLMASVRLPGPGAPGVTAAGLKEKSEGLPALSQAPSVSMATGNSLRRHLLHRPEFNLDLNRTYFIWTTCFFLSQTLVHSPSLHVHSPSLHVHSPSLHVHSPRLHVHLFVCAQASRLKLSVRCSLSFLTTFTPQRFQQRALGPQSLHPRVVLNPQSQNQAPVQPLAQSEGQADPQDPTKARPLLLEEQPLLLQDLLDQERQEQQQQKQMQALIRQRAGSEGPFPSMEQRPNRTEQKQRLLSLAGVVKHSGEEDPRPASHLSTSNQNTSPQSFKILSYEGQRRQYEEWLGETQRLLQMQQRLLEDQIAAHRKTKKALSAKQRTAKKAGRPFAEEDAAQLRYVTEQQGTVQKQLEQIRKQQKDHCELIEDYRSKLQPRPLQPPPGAPLMPPTPGPGSLVPPGAPHMPPALVPGSLVPPGAPLMAPAPGPGSLVPPGAPLMPPAPGPGSLVPPGAPLMPPAPGPGSLVPPGAPVGPGLMQQQMVPMQHPPRVPVWALEPQAGLLV